MKKFIITLVSLFVSLTVLAACGFHPVHGDYNGKKSISSGVPQVAIGNIPDREGQMLRNALIDRIGNATDGAVYSVRVSKIEETKKELAITKSSEATRAQLRLKTHMTLNDPSGRRVLSRDLQALTSYNILESEFATRVTENSARENAINDLARQIELNINLYLERK